MDAIEVSKLDELLNMVGELQKSVLIPEWIEDLEVSKKASETYADSARMNALVAESSATRNVAISDILYEWAVDNSVLPVFFTSCVGTETVTSWSTYTTPASICANTAAFSAVANNEAAIKGLVRHVPSRRQMFLNWSFTESALQNSSYAISALTEVESVWEQRRNQSLVFTKDMFALRGDHDDVGIDVTFTKPGGSTVRKNSSPYTYNLFATKCEGRIEYFDLHYVDCSGV